jgi:hypothetical protein
MYPQFLIIGAQKAGTTWLDRNLRQHPQIWLPPEKEIHFFDLPRPLPFAALLFAPVRAARHWAKARLQRDWSKVRAREQKLSWYLKYYFQLRTEGWYGSLFQPAKGQVCGEATPRYAPLPEDQISRIRQLMPDLKIIYLLRDPIDRMWSDLAMFERPRFGGKGLRHAGGERIKDFLSDPHNLAHSRYADNLARWEKFFPQSQIFLAFHEEIAEEPGALLRRLVDFLGVDGNVPFPLACERINSKRYPPVRAAMARHLARELAEDTKALHSRCQNASTAAWLDRNREIRRRKPLVA